MIYTALFNFGLKVGILEHSSDVSGREPFKIQEVIG